MDYNKAFAGSLTDGVLADAILTPPNDTAHQSKEGKSPQKSTETKQNKTLGRALDPRANSAW